MMSPSRKDESERKPFLTGIVHFFEYLQSIHCVHRIAVIITQWPTFTFDIRLFFFFFFLSSSSNHLLFSHSFPNIPCGPTIRMFRISTRCASHIRYEFFANSFTSSRWKCGWPTNSSCDTVLTRNFLPFFGCVVNSSFICVCESGSTDCIVYFVWCEVSLE